MSKRETVNLALHIGVGGALAALVLWHPLFIILVTFIYAWLREKAQHRLVLTHDDSATSASDRKLFAVDKQTFFGWMTGHRIFEVFQWVIGAAVVSIPWYFFG